MHLLASVKWGELSRTTDYVYGSSIRRQGKDILFENQHFASGRTIKKWLSKTNFQAHRMTPSLPLLKAGTTYRLEKNYRTQPKDASYLLIEYYNRRDEIIGKEILKHQDWTFTLPDETYWYSMSLIGAGCHQLHFQSILIYGEDKERSLVLEGASSQPYKEGEFPSELWLVQPLIETADDEGVQ